MRIFVMFGTQDKRFDRLFQAIEQSRVCQENEVYMQVGYTTGESADMNCQQYYSEEELLKQIRLADIVITHAGVGAIVASLKAEKPTIVVPRLAKYKEQNNDHQLQIMERYCQEGYIIAVDNIDNLEDAIEEARVFEVKPYHPNKEAIIKEIKDFIDGT